MAMAMALAKTILGGHLIVAKKSAYFMTKGGILAGRGDVGWIARGMNVSRVEHDVDGAPDPREQSRELMAAEFVAAAEHFGAAIRIDGEARVLKAPDVEALGIPRGRPEGLG